MKIDLVRRVEFVVFVIDNERSFYRGFFVLILVFVENGGEFVVIVGDG